jgi:hypothetical protein
MDEALVQARQDEAATRYYDLDECIQALRERAKLWRDLAELLEPDES